MSELLGDLDDRQAPFVDEQRSARVPEIVWSSAVDADCFSLDYRPMLAPARLGRDGARGDPQ